MHMKRFAFATVTALLIAGSVFAGTNVVGAWKGKTKINRAKLPPMTNPQQHQQMEAQVAMMEKATLGLTLNKNGTCSVSVTGIAIPGGKQPPARTGTWALKGNQLSLSFGKTKMPPEVFTLAKNGKSFSIEQHGVAVTTFTR
jgi:nicotinamide mononucleotide (NMN) deamidase PncC